MTTCLFCNPRTIGLLATGLGCWQSCSGASPRPPRPVFLPAPLPGSLFSSAELVFPPTANVFYARSSSSLDFVLRPRPPQQKPPPSPPRLLSPRGVDISATFPKIKATGRKIAKALF